MQTIARVYKRITAASLLLLTASAAIAGNVTATSKTDLQTKVTNAMPGDTVFLQNGTYNWGDISLTNGNATSGSAPIVVKPVSIGGVIFNGQSRLRFYATRLEINGFIFQNGSAGTSAVIRFSTGSSTVSTYCRVTNVKIDGYNSGLDSLNEWVGLYGDHNRLDHCSFINKNNGKATVIVWYGTTTYPAPAAASYHLIDSNYFSGRGYLGTNGGETIRIGDSNSSRTKGYNTVEYNLFEGCRQTEPEIISNKSGFNVYRYNTFKNSKGGLTLRHGRYCEVYANFFINDTVSSGVYGIRIIDKGHRVYNNYIENINANKAGTTSDQKLAPISTYNGISRDSTNPAYAADYFPTDSIIVAFNTIVNCNGGGGIVLGCVHGGSVQPLGMQIQYNLIKMSAGAGVYMNSGNTSLTYKAKGNMYQAPSGLGIANTTGFSAQTLTFGSRVDGILNPPSLVADQIYRDSFIVGTLTYRTLINHKDIKRLTRGVNYDVGCKEVSSSGTILNVPLTSCEVGIAGCGARYAGPSRNLSIAEPSISLYPNPAGSMITLQMPETLKGSIYTIVDANGRTVRQFSGKESTVNIPLSNLPNGMYYIQWVNEKGTQHSPFMINR